MSLTYTPRFEEYQISVFRALKKTEKLQSEPFAAQMVSLGGYLCNLIEKAGLGALRLDTASLGAFNIYPCNSSMRWNKCKV
jgi:hypothetical protein